MRNISHKAVDTIKTHIWHVYVLWLGFAWWNV